MGLYVRIAISAHIYAKVGYAALIAEFGTIDVMKLDVNFQSSVHQKDAKKAYAVLDSNVEV